MMVLLESKQAFNIYRDNGGILILSTIFVTDDFLIFLSPPTNKK